MKYITEHVWYSVQNLTDRKHSTWLSGRGWIHGEHKCVGLEWHLLKFAHHCMIEMQLNGDARTVGFTLAIPWLFYLHLSIEGFLGYEWFPEYYTTVPKTIYGPAKNTWLPETRTIGIRIFGGAIWFSLWENPAEWRKDQPWWWAFNWHFDDFFLGEQKHSSVDLSETEQAVHLPESDYPVTVRMFESTWKRPRWFTKKIIRADIQCNPPIPSHAGKGENSWDLEDDSTSAATIPASTPEEACEKLAAGILRDRQRYGEPALQ